MPRPCHSCGTSSHCYSSSRRVISDTVWPAHSGTNELDLGYRKAPRKKTCSTLMYAVVRAAHKCIVGRTSHQCRGTDTAFLPQLTCKAEQCVPSHRDSEDVSVWCRKSWWRLRRPSCAASTRPSPSTARTRPRRPCVTCAWGPSGWVRRKNMPVALQLGTAAHRKAHQHAASGSLPDRCSACWLHDSSFGLFIGMS